MESVRLNKIYNENCDDTINRMSDGFLDLIITSPPYNLGKNHHTQNKRHTPYFDDLPEDVYQNKQITVLNKLYSKTKDNGSLIYNHKNRIKNGVQITPYEWLLKTKWIIKQELVWFNGSPNFDKIRFYPMTERVYWLAKSSETKLINKINHHDLFTTKEWKPQGTNKFHTRSFPQKMVEDFLECFPDAQIIYDPFLGSGTTCIAAKKLNRIYIGSEIREDYYNYAKEEIKSLKTEKLCQSPN